MMTCRTAVLTCFVVAFAFCVSSRADSDGSFCTFRGYLAFEMRNGITPGVTGHVLKVVRFEPKRGIYMAGEVTLDDFQVHRMICGQDRVEISGWANLFIKYTIDIGTPGRLRIVDRTEDRTRQFDASKDGPEPPQFGYSKPGPIALESFDPDHKYTLLLSASEKTVQGGIAHHRKAELTRTSTPGTVSQSVLLYENESLETID